VLSGGLLGTRVCDILTSKMCIHVGPPANLNQQIRAKVINTRKQSSCQTRRNKFKRRYGRCSGDPSCALPQHSRARTLPLNANGLWTMTPPTALYAISSVRSASAHGPVTQFLLAECPAARRTAQ